MRIHEFKHGDKIVLYKVDEYKASSHVLNEWYQRWSKNCPVGLITEARGGARIASFIINIKGFISFSFIKSYCHFRKATEQEEFLYDIVNFGKPYLPEGVGDENT